VNANPDRFRALRTQGPWEVMKLDLRFTTRPLEEIWCETAVAFVFIGPSGEWEGASGLDAKTSGFLASLKEKGFWAGDEGDTLLVASQDMIKADRILLQGCGGRAGWSMEAMGRMAEEVGVALNRMAGRDIGVNIPVLKGMEKEYHSHLEEACIHMVDPFRAGHGDDPDFLLKVVFSVDESQIDRLELRLENLRERLSAELDCTLLFERQDGQHPELDQHG
jgi:cytosol aminopeptidase family protein